MANSHKAPTQVSIAPLEEKSALQETVERFWMPATLIAIAIAAGILFVQNQNESEKAAADQSWNELGRDLDMALLLQGGDLPAASALGAISDSLADTQAGPWAQALEARALIDEGRFADARTVIDGLAQSFPDHPLVSRQLAVGGEDAEGETTTIVANLRALADDREAWAGKSDSLEGPPPVADDAPRVRLKTSKGDILVGLYPDRAPQHVENFLKLCSESYYDGTLFHRVLKDQIIQGGDPNTREDDEASWGQGGPDYTVPAEITDAWHFKGMLAAAKAPQAVESSGSQFYFTGAPVHHLDKQYTVFGRVLEGQDVVDALIAEAPAQGDRPEAPASLDATEVL